MPLDKSVIKARTAESTTFDYQPKDFALGTSEIAKSFVDTDSFQSPDFKISELIAKQAGISQLENEVHLEKINAQVLDRLKDIQEDAYKQGYELGLVDGAQKAFEETKVDLLDRLKSFETLLARVEHLRTQLMIDNEAGLLKLLFLIAKKMALRDIQTNPEATWLILKDIVDEMQSEETLIVKVSLEDLVFLESLQEKSGQKIEALKRVKFMAEDGITSGGCLIESQYGKVDATVEERVERTWQTLQSRIPQKNVSE